VSTGTKDHSAGGNERQAAALTRPRPSCWEPRRLTSPCRGR